MGIGHSVLARAEAGEPVAPASAKAIADHYGYSVTDIWPVTNEAAAA